MFCEALTEFFQGTNLPFFLVLESNIQLDLNVVICKSSWLFLIYENTKQHLGANI